MRVQWILNIFQITRFFKSNAFFGPGSNDAQRNPKFPKFGLTLPDKKVLKYYLGREQSFDKGFAISTFRLAQSRSQRAKRPLTEVEGFRVQFSKFSEIHVSAQAKFRLMLLIKVLLIKKACSQPIQGDRVMVQAKLNYLN